MKTKLLILCALLIFTFSCSVDPVIDTQVNEERVIVKRAMQYVYKISQTTSYYKFVEELKSKSADTVYSDQQIEEMINAYLDTQSPEFVAAYNMLISLDLSEPELVALAIELREEIIGNDNPEDDKSSCSIFGSGLGGFALIIGVLCGSRDTDSDDR